MHCRCCLSKKWSVCFSDMCLCSTQCYHSDHSVQHGGHSLSQRHWEVYPDRQHHVWHSAVQTSIVHSHRRQSHVLRAGFLRCKQRSTVFTCYAEARLSYISWTSVRLSVTRWYCIKTAEHIMFSRFDTIPACDGQTDGRPAYIAKTQHVPIYLQPFPSNSNRKFNSSLF